MKLSILICHLKARKLLLDELLAILQSQTTDEVEVLVDPTDGITTGAKRNALLGAAKGDYVAFVDDDDQVSANYCRSILGAVKTLPDCVGMRGIIWVAGRLHGYFEHSLSNAAWVEDKSKAGCRFLRPPNHLNPVKRELAIKTRFPDKTVGEDSDYSMRLLPLLKTEVMIPAPIYAYHARFNIAM